MSATCCTEYINFGCYDLCDANVSNLKIVAIETGTYTATFTLGGIVHTIEAAGVDGEPLTFSNVS